MPDWPSFSWGALAGLGVAFATGFFKKAGESLFTAISARLKPPEPVQVEGTFELKLLPPGSCAWVSEYKVYDYEQQGYTYYPHGKRKAKCFRQVGEGANAHKKFAMVRPGIQ